MPSYPNRFGPDEIRRIKREDNAPETLQDSESTAESAVGGAENYPQADLPSSDNAKNLSPQADGFSLGNAGSNSPQADDISSSRDESSSPQADGFSLSGDENSSLQEDMVHTSDREESPAISEDEKSITCANEKDKKAVRATEQDRKKVARNIKFYSYAVIGFIVLFIVFSNTFVRVRVVGDSMNPTYSDGQVIWANSWKKPKYGDVVILKNPYYGIKQGEPEVVLKRVRGFGGDEFWFEINPDDNSKSDLWRKSGGVIMRIQVGVDNEKTSGIFAHGNLSENRVFTGYNVIYHVPDGCVFVLGDNFNHSEDGRYYGGVSTKDIKGVIY